LNTTCTDKMNDDVAVSNCMICIYCHCCFVPIYNIYLFNKIILSLLWMIVMYSGKIKFNKNKKINKKMQYCQYSNPVTILCFLRLLLYIFISIYIIFIIIYHSTWLLLVTLFPNPHLTSFSNNPITIFAVEWFYTHFLMDNFTPSFH